jgi:hypothetical protein
MSGQRSEFAMAGTAFHQPAAPMIEILRRHHQPRDKMSITVDWLG